MTFHERSSPLDGNLVRRYEVLRTSKSPSLERNLLIRSGMVVWMDAWSESFDFSDLPADALAQRGGQKKEVIHREGSSEQHCDLENLLPAAYHSQVVGLLAGIACVVLGD
jgi:hypothetical protein